MSIFDLTGKTALITGAASGLGERFAIILSQAGAKVITADLNLVPLEILTKKILQTGKQAIPMYMDVSDKSSVQNVVNTLEAQGERIDILINSAGISIPTPIFEPDEKNNFEAIMQTNLMGVWYVTKAVANHMKNHGIAGSIISIGSVNGANKVRENNAAYNVSKAGVIHLTKSLVGELSKANIRINCILPGLFHTPLSHYKLQTPQDRKEMVEVIPLGFIPQPVELDGTVLYLASNKASRYVTGSNITVDGGASWGGVKSEPTSMTSHK